MAELLDPKFVLVVVLVLDFPGCPSRQILTSLIKHEKEPHILSRRDNPIVAWHEVPGKASSERTVLRVRYDRMVGRSQSQRYFLVERCAMLL